MRFPLAVLVRSTFSLILLTTISMSSPKKAAAEEKIYQNDGFQDGMMVAVQQGFVSGEIGAACFSPPPEDAPVRLLAIQLLFGGGREGETRLVEAKVWQDGGNGKAPANMVWSGEVELTSSDQAISEIDLSDANISVAGSFCAGIQFRHSGVPSIARDNDGSIDRGDNWIYAMDPTSGQPLGWFESAMFGVSGDWIIRVIGETSGGGGPGSDPEPDPVDAGVESDAVETGAESTFDSGSDLDSGTVEVFIESVSPSSARTDEDVLLTISGGGFLETYTYRIGPASLVDGSLVDSSTVQGTLRAGSLEPGTYDVIISERGQTLATYPQGFQVRPRQEEETSAPPLPSITSINPKETVLGSSVNVTVTGRNFMDGAVILVAQRELPVTNFIDETTLQAFIPGDHVEVPGKYDVEVHNPDGRIARLSDGFTFSEDVVASGPALGETDGCACSLVSTTGRLGTSETRGTGAILWMTVLGFAVWVVRRRR